MKIKATPEKWREPAAIKAEEEVANEIITIAPTPKPIPRKPSPPTIRPEKGAPTAHPITGVERALPNSITTSEAYVTNAAKLRKYAIVLSPIFGLKPEFLESLANMAEAFYSKTGKKFQVESGYRTYTAQLRVMDKRSKYAAKPGYSPHEYGVAVDITNAEGSHAGDVDKLASFGLLKKYGLNRPLLNAPTQKESWHIEPEWYSDLCVSSGARGGKWGDP